MVYETTYKGLISKIYKQLIKHNIRKKKKNQPHQKQAEDLNRHLSKEDIQMANRHMKTLNITNYYRNANKNYLTPIRTAIIQKSTNSKC